jgi:uncharacterized protein
MQAMRSGTWLGLTSALVLVPLLAPLASNRVEAAVDCRQRASGAAERAICMDLELAGLDHALVRRMAGLERRLSLGQYLGLRYWDRAWSQRRTECGADRACLMDDYRHQMREVTRLQLCLDSGIRRSTCVRRIIFAPDTPPSRRPQ